MTPLSYADYHNPKYDKQLTIKMTENMLKHIQSIADKSNTNISDATRYIIFIGISSLEER